jgi:peptidoglycan/LPS O-acetylase OafA/YrhL
MAWSTLILGAALVVAPFILGYSDNTMALWSSVLLGAVIALVSAYKAIRRTRTDREYYLIALTALAALLSPLLIDFGNETTTWTKVLLGIATLLIALYPVATRTPNPTMR